MAQLPFPIRVECPPGACVCGRDELLADPNGDYRPLRITRQDEQRLLLRIERIATFDDLRHVQELIRSHIGAELRIHPGPNEVRTERGIIIVFEEKPGLCKKLRQNVPAAIRRCLVSNPEITFALLNSYDLLASG